MWPARPPSPVPVWRNHCRQAERYIYPLRPAGSSYQRKEQVIHMPRVLDPASEEANELRKWEQHPTRFALTPDGEMKPGNPYVKREYPKMLYKAIKVPTTGKVVCMVQPPKIHEFPDLNSYQHHMLIAEEINRQCTMTVANEAEERQKKNEGWRNSGQEALDHFEACEQAIGNAAAEAEFARRRMSQQANEEYQAASDATHQHVTDVTGIPSSRRGSRTRAEGVVADPSID